MATWMQRPSESAPRLLHHVCYCDFFLYDIVQFDDMRLPASIYLPPILDLRVQLGDRLGKLRLLISFIVNNGLLGKVSDL
jgi:hypothetical protein